MNRAARFLPTACAAALLAGPGQAATFQVLNNSDGGPGSLRQAVLDANNTPGSDSIEFLTTGQISLSNGQLIVSESLVMNGPGADQLVLDAGGLSRIFNVTGGPLFLSGMTLRNGRASGMQPGGGILANADVFLFRCVLRNCQTPLTIGVSADGGGVFVNTGRQLIAEACLFQNNTVALGTGGAVRCASGAMLEARNCTFSGNSATQGGALSAGSPVALDFCTFADNSATSAGGGVWSPGGPTRTANSIFFGNSAPSGANWLGAVNSGGFNIIGVPLGSSGWGLTDRLNLDPLLAPMTSLGGHGDGYPLQPGSPAQDSADPSSSVAEDQRGLSRPQRLQHDVGAIEMEFVNQPPVANAGADQSVPSEGTGASVQLDGSGSTDPDGDELAFAWFENGVPIAEEELPTVTLANGSHTLMLVVTDEWGASSQDFVTVVVEPPASGDQRKPKIRHIRVRPHWLWPADGNLKNVKVTYTVKDNSDPNPQVWLTATSNQADSGLGPNDRPGDVLLVDNNNLKLRAERFHRKRVYTITINARDRDGNVATRKVRVFVPKRWWCRRW